MQPRDRLTAIGVIALISLAVTMALLPKKGPEPGTVKATEKNTEKVPERFSTKDPGKGPGTEITTAPETALILLQLHNEERKKKDLPPLSLNAELTKAAQDYAEYLAESGEFSHTAKSTPHERIKEAGYDARASGENIAKGQDSPEEVVQGWMNSKGHRENILRDYFSEVGFGLVRDKEDRCVWVTNFGDR